MTYSSPRGMSAARNDGDLTWISYGCPRDPSSRISGSRFAMPIWLQPLGAPIRVMQKTRISAVFASASSTSCRPHRHLSFGHAAFSASVLHPVGSFRLLTWRDPA